MASLIEDVRRPVTIDYEQWRRAVRGPAKALAGESGHRASIRFCMNVHEILMLMDFPNRDCIECVRNYQVFQLNLIHSV